MPAATMAPPAIESTTTGEAASVRESDPLTSHRAADRAMKKAEASQLEVVEILREHGPLANFEIEAIHAERCTALGLDAPHFSGSRLRSARKELAELGVVEPTGTERPVLRDGVTTKNTAEVWRLTRKGTRRA